VSERRLQDEPMSLEEQSRHHRISRERVRQVEVRAVEKLQKWIRLARARERRS
jgi:RNA polymerase sigma-32 factor